MARPMNPDEYDAALRSLSDRTVPAYSPQLSTIQSMMVRRALEGGATMQTFAGPAVDSVKKEEPFTVGARVKIKPQSRFYSKNENNPGDTIGVITKIRDAPDYSLPIEVKWPTGKNSYSEKDLILASPPILLEMTLGAP